jgi:hypothetical protein
MTPPTVTASARAASERALTFGGRGVFIAPALR